ncbi:MAG: hypothetical protein M3R36_00445 [Bacteroidota bacterium]|nr:hypothetical protein [Bacteroidota bacterium]
MDNAVALVNAYLQINGYFTVAEYPIVEHLKGDNSKLRSATDIDIMGVRFSNAGIILEGKNQRKDLKITTIDEKLEAKNNNSDMIIGEVKEGKAKFNRNIFDPDVLKTVLIRFGCCNFNEVETAVNNLLSKGFYNVTHSHTIRMIIFCIESEFGNKYKTISLKHIVSFLKAYINNNWEFFKTANYKDQGLGFMVTIEKILKESKPSA